MTNFKTFAAWLVIVLVTAGGTVLGLQVIQKPFDLQQKIAKIGK